MNHHKYKIRTKMEKATYLRWYVWTTCKMTKTDLHEWLRIKNKITEVL